MNGIGAAAFSLEDDGIRVRRQGIEGLKPKDWHIKMFDLHSSISVQEYQKTRLNLFNAIAKQEAYIIRENSVTLTQNGIQKVFTCIEWVDVEPEKEKISTLDANGCPLNHKKRIKNAQSVVK